MRKYLIGIAAMFVAVFAMNPGVANAASAAEYHAEFSSTNLYTGSQILIYHFTGLDPNADYIWLLQGLNDSGTGRQALSTKYLDGDGVTTIHTITFTAATNDFDNQDSTAFSGPARVIDNYGNELGVHYLLSSCFDDSYKWCADSHDWANAGGVNAVDQRVGIGNRFVDIPRNGNGYFHPTDNPNAVLTTQGDYTFLHYQYDPLIVPTNEIYQIYDIAEATLLYQFYLDDLYKYNDDIRRVTIGETVQTRNFVVLSTNGKIPDWINHIQNDAAWTIGDNPHEASFGPGAYDYERTDVAGVNIDDGESVWLVSRGGAGREWTMTSGQAGIGANNSHRVVLESATTEIWDDGFFDHEFEDSQMGVIDSDNYAFIPRRNYVYTVGPVEGAAVATWKIYPTLSNLPGVNLAHRRFEIDMNYSITAAMAIQDRFENTLAGFGFDTPLGRGLAMLLVMAVAMLFIAKKGAKGLVAFALTFLFIGGTWIAIGLGDALTTVLFGASAIVIIFLLVQNRRKDEGFG